MDICSPQFHVIFWPNANSCHVLLRSNNVFERQAKFLRKATMGDEDKANHGSRQAP